MGANPLHETYTVCGKNFDIYTKTGRYNGIGREGRRYGTSYHFIREDGDAEEKFWFEAPTDLVLELKLELGDRVTMALFGKNGSTFLMFNHRNSNHSYYPAAVRDLIYSLKSGFFAEIRNTMKLMSEARLFPDSQTFSRILDRIKRL